MIKNDKFIAFQGLLPTFGRPLSLASHLSLAREVSSRSHTGYGWDTAQLAWARRVLVEAGLQG